MIIMDFYMIINTNINKILNIIININMTFTAFINSSLVTVTAWSGS